MVHSLLRRGLIIITCLSLLFVSACGTGSTGSAETSQRDESGTQGSTSGAASDQGDESGVQDEDSDAADVAETLLRANRQFAFQLYDEVTNQDENDNVFISPFSVFMALSMTYNGADEETKEAMARALHMQDMSLKKVNEANAALIEEMRQADPDVALHIANSLWGREGTPFKSDFLEKNTQYYDAKVTELNFNDPQAANTINDWVRDQTNGKIEKIVGDNIDPETILFLINAIYFKGGWTDPFNEASTAEQDFHLLDGTTQPVPMMSQTGKFAHYDGEDFEAIRLPYGNERLGMTVILPDTDTGLDQFHKKLSVENWQAWLANFKKETGKIQLPRFQLEYETQLNDVLQAMGMGVAFDKQKANFERMAKVAPETVAYIKEVKHKSFIDVNEEGSEAAAATSVEISLTSAPATTFNMIVDRPFFFVIHDNETGTPLFMGSVVEP